MTYPLCAALTASIPGVEMARVHAGVVVIMNDKRIALCLPSPARRVVHS